MRRSEKKEHDGKHTRPNKWSRERQTCRTGDDGPVVHKKRITRQKVKYQKNVCKK